MDECEICGGSLALLGLLGLLYHYRCRNCGMEFSSEAAPPDVDDDKDTPTDDQP